METVVTPENLEAFFKLVLTAASAGKWAQLVALALVGLVWLLRKLIVPKVPFFATGEGGALLTVLTSFVGALATAVLAPGVTFSWTLVSGAFYAALMAAGGWSLAKHLLPLVMKLPFLAALFPPKGDGPVLVADAEKLAAAVTAKAPTPEELANGKP
jgi:hypothetical protein